VPFFEISNSSKAFNLWSFRSAAKASKVVKAESSEDEGEPASDAEEGEPKVKKRKPKGTGGIHVPEEWPWEEAKKVFEEPEVIPADQIQVRGSFRFKALFH
jgi:flap endonuclease-1